MLKRIVKKIIYHNHSTNDEYISFLKSKGAKIGEGTVFYSPQKHPVDETSCHFIAIGSNCRITEGVTILGHDYSYAVCRPTHHAMLLKSGVTSIGDNVFIGINAIVLMNTVIGNNCIIGAGAVVSGKFGDNLVIAGNPAKEVCTLEEYYRKLRKNFENSARIYYERKSKLLGRPLIESEMSWYVALWKTEDLDARRKMLYQTTKVDGDDKDMVIEDVLKYEPVYNSFDEFVANIGAS